jgi:hypothetical protein
LLKVLPQRAASATRPISAVRAGLVVQREVEQVVVRAVLLLVLTVQGAAVVHPLVQIRVRRAVAALMVVHLVVILLGQETGQLAWLVLATETVEVPVRLAVTIGILAAVVARDIF